MQSPPDKKPKAATPGEPDGLRRFVIGTAGHVDHGKTTLVHALTGVDTDRLPEEKRRGITIELGFASWSLDERTRASIIDVPGHRRLVHTMIAGAVGMEVVLLVVAADEGVMPQTREHLAVCQLLGIERFVVALTKIDRVDRDLVELAIDDVDEELRARFGGSPKTDGLIVPVSAKTGEGLDKLKDVMLRTLEKTLEQRGERGAPRGASDARLSVDRVFAIKGAGSVVTGTLVSGQLVVGQPIRVVRASDEAHETTARGLHVHDRPVREAQAPSRVAVNLGGVALADLERGAVLTTDPAVRPTNVFDVVLRLVKPIKSGATVDAYVGTARSAARVVLFKASDVAGAPVFARIKLDAPLVVAGDDRVIFRGSATRGPSGAVVAGGVVLDARPKVGRRRIARSHPSLAALNARSAVDAARALVVEASPGALQESELGGRFPISSGALASAAEKLAEKGEVIRLHASGKGAGKSESAARSWVDRASTLGLALRVRVLASEHHASHPHDKGIAIETLRQKIAARAGVAVADEAIRLAARPIHDAAARAPRGHVDEDASPLVLEGDTARRASFTQGAQGTGPVAKVIVALREAQLKGLGEHAITELLGLPGKEVRAILARVVRDGSALATGGQWFDRPSVDALRERITQHFAARGVTVLTIAQFKDMSGLGRKQAIPFLELFDSEGMTIRRGDDRVAGPRARAKLAAP